MIRQLPWELNACELVGSSHAMQTTLPHAACAGLPFQGLDTHLDAYVVLRRGSCTWPSGCDRQPSSTGDAVVMVSGGGGKKEDGDDSVMTPFDARAGDVVLVRGGVFHRLAAGACVLRLSYHLAVLSQTQNMYLHCPPKRALDLPRAGQRWESGCGAARVAPPSRPPPPTPPSPPPRLIGYAKPGEVLNKL